MTGGAMRTVTRAWPLRALLAAILAAGLLLATSQAQAAPALDARGTWLVKGPGIPDQPWRITSLDMATGALSGSGGPTNSFTWPITGSMDGYVVTMNAVYDQLPSYKVTFVGTVSADGQTMSGLWANTGSTPSQAFTATRTDAPPATGGTPPPPPPPTTTGKRPSVVSVVCNRGPDATSTSQCTATVGDAGAPPRATPTGTVAWSATQGSFAASTCALSPTPLSPGVASCTVTYQPGPSGTPAGTALPVTARYGGDARLAPSQGGHALIAALCIGTPNVPCPGTVADAFGFKTQVSVGLKAALDALRAQIACGTGTQSAAAIETQVGLAPYGCTFDLKALGLDLDAAALASQLDALTAQTGSLLDALRDAYDCVGQGSKEMILGPGLGGASGLGGCRGMLQALGFSGPELARQIDKLTTQDAAAAADLLRDMFLQAVAKKPSLYDAILSQALKDSFSPNASPAYLDFICRDVLSGAPSTSRVLAAVRRACQNRGAAQNARRATPVALATGTGTVLLGATGTVRLALTTRGRIISHILRKLRVRSVPIRLSVRMTAPGVKPVTVTRRIVLRIR